MVLYHTTTIPYTQIYTNLCLESKYQLLSFLWVGFKNMWLSLLAFLHEPFSVYSAHTWHISNIVHWWTTTKEEEEMFTALHFFLSFGLEGKTDNTYEYISQSFMRSGEMKGKTRGSWVEFPSEGSRYPSIPR